MLGRTFVERLMIKMDGDIGSALRRLERFLLCFVYERGREDYQNITDFFFHKNRVENRVNDLSRENQELKMQLIRGNKLDEPKEGNS